MSKMSDHIRKNFKKTDEERDAGLQTPDNIIRYDDIVYGNDKNIQVLDVYKLKEDINKPIPTIISVHGGGWVYGDKEKYQYYCMDLAQRGFAVVNFTYRLAPENKFPAALEDTCMVFNWVWNHKEEYGFDTDHIFAVGDSAGANILSLACAIACNEEYANQFDFNINSNFKVKAIALNCGTNIIEVSNHPKDKFSTELMKDYLENEGTKEELYLVNALNHINETYPPTFLMSAEDDFLKSQMLPVASKLLEKNVPFVVKYYKDSCEKLGHVFHLNIRSNAANRCNDDECEFFKSFIMNKPF